jgi:hypothetical protein
MPISIPSGRTLPLKSKAGGGFQSLNFGGGGIDPVNPVGLLFYENFNDQPDYVANPNNAKGGLLTSLGDPMPLNWDGSFASSEWNPGLGYADKHYSFEILAADADKAFGGTGKAMVNYRESKTDWPIRPEQGVVTLPFEYTHVRIWMSTSRDFNTAKSATATIGGVDYTFTATTGADGSAFAASDGDPADTVRGVTDTQFNSIVGQRPHVSVFSNPIAISVGTQASIVGGDLQGWDSTNNTPKWDARTAQFVSDSQLIKAFIDPNNPTGTEELYVEFLIRFAPDWYHRGHYDQDWFSKIFRCAHYNPAGSGMFSGSSGSDGALGPMVYWDYKADRFGLRDLLSFRGGPPPVAVTESNYRGTPVETDFGGGSGFWGAYNIDGIAGQAVGGGDPQLPDLVNGGLIAEFTGPITHEMLFGPTEKWTKIAFYVKMNSAPGVADGIFSQYIDGHRIKHAVNVPYVAANTENLMVGWNHFSLGGNDNFHPYPNADFYEDWYAIDEVKVRDSLPEVL